MAVAEGPGKPLTARFPALHKLRLGGRRRRIRFCQQTSAIDCGPACLAMVLDLFGRQVRLEDVRAVTGFGRDGASALNLLEGGRRLGLRGRGVKVEELDDLGYLPRGAILHWNFSHFVVLLRARRGGAEILDPAIGRRFVPRRQLADAFTGVALVFEPAEGFERGSTRGSETLVWYARKLSAYSSELVKILVTSILCQLFALSIPLLIGALVDRVVPRGDYPLLTVLSAGLAAIVVFHFATTLLRSYLLLYVRTRVEASLSLEFLEHLVALPFPFFQRRSAGDLMLRLTSNATIREILTSSVLSGLLDGLLLTFYLVFLFLADSTIGLLALGLGAARIVVFVLTRRRHRDLMSQTLQAQADSQGYQVQLLAGIQTLKASGAEDRAVTRWSHLLVSVLNASLARGQLSAWVDASLAALEIASPVLILNVGVLSVLRGEMSLGTLLAANALAVGFLSPLSNVVRSAFQLQLVGSYLDRAEDVLGTAKEQDPERQRRTARLQGAIRLEDVCFRYAPQAPLVIQDIRLEVSPASFVALVGRSGSGKSTLAHLLVGLYVPTSGRIFFDGIDASELDLRSLRSQLGVVEQYPFIFGGTVLANISMDDPSVGLGQVVEAARLAQIHADVEAMPLGYDTMLADGGSSLSGGQRQRIALARALLRQPPILLLDEATSQLDAISESCIHQELRALRSTRIVIAHRLSTVINADLILVLADGRVVEQGRHHELMRAGGVYAELVEKQLAGREPVAAPRAWSAREGVS